MPAVELMSWNKTQKRWFKKYRGKMYSVSPATRNRSDEGRIPPSRQRLVDEEAEGNRRTDRQSEEAPRQYRKVLWNSEGESSALCQVAKEVWQSRVAEKSEAVMEWRSSRVGGRLSCWAFLLGYGSRPFSAGIPNALESSPRRPGSPPGSQGPLGEPGSGLREQRPRNLPRAPVR